MRNFWLGLEITDLTRYRGLVIYKEARRCQSYMSAGKR
jgi:hypothetical protein